MFVCLVFKTKDNRINNMCLKQKDDRKLIRTKKKQLLLLYSKQIVIVSTKDSVFKTPTNISMAEYVDEM